MKKILKNACIKCGGDITVVWADKMSESFALACDVCPKCYELQPCGHPLSAIITNGTTSYCGQCADDSLRANIAAGVEA